MPKRRALYLLFHYPSITEAYVEAEIRAVSHAYEAFVIATDAHPTGVTPYRLHSPYRVIPDRATILESIQSYHPHVLHAHRLFMLPLLAPICAELGIPFTVRSHAHDAIPSRDPRVAGWMQQAPQLLPNATSSRLCLGILAFPFTRRHLEGWGVPRDKIHDCYPVVDFSRFHDPSPNGDTVVNAGSYMPKKNMEAFLERAWETPAAADVQSVRTLKPPA